MPKILEPPVLGVDPKILGDCTVDVVAEASLGLLASKSNPLKPLEGAAVELLPGADDRPPRLAKGLLASCEGLLPNKTDAPPALVLGGGPAGVVEFPKRFVVGLLVGVVVVV